MSLFENIRYGDLPVNNIFQEEFINAFEDKHHSAPINILIIPNKLIIYTFI